MNQEKGQSDINRDRMTKEGEKSNRNETKRKSVRNFNDRKVKDKRGENLKRIQFIKNSHFTLEQE